MKIAQDLDVDALMIALTEVPPFRSYADKQHALDLLNVYLDIRAKRVQKALDEQLHNV